ncbi:hypothetical protein HC256_004159 [Beauveria bassiana]|nr:hypothetical protein HC256_004159 [Beauveria bassiana]
MTVLAEMVDENDWPSPPPALLWVLDTGFSLELWYDIRQRPRVGDPAHKMIRNVIGHHEDAYGDVHYAVLWEGYLCPGWISDEDLYSHKLAGITGKPETTCVWKRPLVWRKQVKQFLTTYGW